MECSNYDNEITNTFFCFNYHYFIILNIFLYSYMILMLWDKMKINDQYLNTFINTVWYLLRNLFIIYIWTNETIIKPTIGYLNQYNIFNSKNTKYKYVIICDGFEIMRFKDEDELHNHILISYLDEDILHYINDDLIYYSKVNDFIKISNKYKKLHSPNQNISFEKSNIAFFSCYVFIELTNNRTINFCIELKKFMVVNNKLLSKSFITWYANNYLKEQFSINDIKLCNVIILDGNVKEHRILFDDYNDNIMKIKKDNYTIKQITYNHIYEKPHDNYDSDLSDDTHDTADTNDKMTDELDNTNNNDDESTSENEIHKIIKLDNSVNEDSIHDSLNCDVNNDINHDENDENDENDDTQTSDIEIMEDINFEINEVNCPYHNDNKHLELGESSDSDEDYDKLNNVNSSWWSLFMI